MKRIILFGGSFDPIHRGHLEMAKQALKQRQADAVWFLISQQSPFKDQQTAFHHRQVMCEMMTHYHRKFRVETIENELPVPSYSYDTLMALKKKHPQFEFEWLMGSDQLERLQEWKNIKEFEQETKILIYHRYGDSKSNHKYFKISGPEIDVSSTALRQGLNTATHPHVLRYMMLENLYTEEMLAHTLSKKRVQHTLWVRDLALELSHNHKNWVECSALMHDFTKEYTPENQHLEMRKTGYRLDQPEALYHAYTAASLLSKVYYVKERVILRAIRSHVTGSGTTSLAKILFIADKCERGRDYDSEPLIQLSKENLDAGFKAVKAVQQDYRRGE